MWPRSGEPQYGIPHILAGDYGSLGYGYGYAFAQDNLCVMADRVITLRGERSRYFGPAADSGDTLGAATDNLDSDIYYQSLRKSGIVRRLLARPAPLGPTAQARQLVDGYVAGYNRYLHDTGVAHLPDPTCRGKAWVTPITATDVWTLIYDIDTLAGAAGAKQDIATARPPTTTAPAAPRVPVVNTGNVSSNGWALGRDATVNHDGMVLANPHVPWTGNARIYQVQLTIPGQLNVSGASLYGTPVVEFGHTQGVAWTATASHAQRFTLYRLALVPGDPTSYLVDGHAVAMTKQTVTAAVRGPGGHLSRVTRTLYRSRYGPLLATGWTATTAFAIDDANADNLRSVNEWLAMARSQNLAQLRAAQDTYQGLPWMYTLATDTSGTVYFADASVAPHVTDAEARRCQVGAPGARGTVILDGSTSSCGWGSDPDAIEPGIFGPSHYPQLTRTDYVANSNNSPELANPSAPITGYPAAIYDTRAELELRPRLSLNMITQRLAGTDGYGPPGFTLSTLQETMLGAAQLQRRPRPRRRGRDVPRPPGADRQQRCQGQRDAPHAASSPTGTAAPTAPAAARSCGGRHTAASTTPTAGGAYRSTPRTPSPRHATSTPAIQQCSTPSPTPCSSSGPTTSPSASPWPAPSTTPGFRCPAAPKAKAASTASREQSPKAAASIPPSTTARPSSWPPSSRHRAPSPAPSSPTPNPPIPTRPITATKPSCSPASNGSPNDSPKPKSTPTLACKPPSCTADTDRANAVAGPSRDKVHGG